MASAQVVIKGNVYGGGMEGKVKNPSGSVKGNTTVTLNDGTVEGSVYGGGKGVLTDETFGLVEGNTTVTMTGGIVERSIYGGGSLGSVGTWIDSTLVSYTEGPNAGVSVYVPTKSATGTGKTTVTVSGGSVGLRGSLMPWDDHNPDDDDRGWIFCGSRGEADSITYPRVIAMGVVNATHLEINKTETTVPLITASVYGGCENGLVLDSTFVKIMGGQIGTGLKKIDTINDVLVGDFADPYTESNWTDAINAVKNGTIETALAGSLSNTFYACDAWKYGVVDVNSPTGSKKYDVYDIYYDSLIDPNDPNSHYRPYNTDSIGSNGQSFFGNVFGGGSGYYPIAPGVWRRTAGRVNGNTRVEITGGHILTSVYGGNEVTDVMGRTTIKMSGGTIGVPRSNADIQDHPVLCNLFGSGKGDQRVWANKWTNVDSTIVEFTGGTIFGSIFGGGEDGHVLGSTYVTVDGDALIGTLGYSGFEGHVYGSGRGFSGDALTAGNVGGNTNITIESGTILGSIYGGGRNASVGPKLCNIDELLYGQMQPDDEEGTHGHTYVTINGGVIGNDYESKLHRIDNNQGGNVFGGSMGAFSLLDGSLNTMWPRMSKVKSTDITIDGENTIIKGNVFGGCKLGTVTEDASVTLKDGTVWGSVYGSGYGSDNNTFAANNVVIVETPTLHDSTYSVTPRRHAGRVYGNTTVTMEGGWVKKNVYGGGDMASVGTITDEIFVHSEIDSLSIGWPVRLTYAPNTGTCTVNINGGRIGITGNDFMGPWNSSGVPYNPETGDQLTAEQINNAREVNGHVFGGGKGKVGPRREMAELADYVNTEVTVNYTSSTATESNFKPGTPVSAFYSKYSEWTDFGTRGCIVSNLYGASENGHIHDNTLVTLEEGLIGGSLFGGGKGTDMYIDTLWVTTDNGATHTVENVSVHSVTAGKVFGNTYVIMNNGQVLGNVYGGGEYASVGKGNYLGYGEKTGTQAAADSANYVLTSGKCFVTINGGTVGTETWNHNGNVFGSSKGMTYTNVTATPRYNYSRDFFLGYTNFTHVTIGGTTGTGPTILGSVFGGGESGHVRFNSEVTINKGEIGTAYSIGLGEDELAHRGNVYGAGQGIDKIAGTDNYCNSAGSVTLNTKVTVNGGTIHRNVYGGGSLASVGPPPTGYNPGSSLNEVIIKGGTIGEVVTTVNEGVTTYNNYGGDVFGAGRGIIDANAPLAQFATSNNTKVTLDSVMQGSTPVSAAFVVGNVYGGGELGQVKHTTQVDVKAGMVGTIGYTWKHDTDHTDPAVKMDSVFHKTGGSVFGGGRGDLTDPVTNREAALVTDTTHVTISGGHVQYSVYGGGEVASVGLRQQHRYKYNGVWYEDYLPKQSQEHTDSTGVAMVTIRGGQIGPAPKVDATHNVAIGLSGTDGYVFGGGKGIGEDNITDPTHPYSGGSYYAIADVNNTYVTVDMPMPENANDTTNRIWGSTFGGAEDGHVLGSVRTYYKNGLMGTTGTTTYDGNIFGGGRNFSKKNYNAGRVRVNDSIDMCGGQIYGSIFGGGRLALTGIDLYGNILPDTADVKHGNTFVKVSGGTVGNNDTIEEWIASSMGDVYGAGKGDTIGIYGHPKASALLVSLVKNAEVLITDTVIDGNPRSPRILGSVFGGGEVACVGQFTWNIGEYSGVTNIGDITPVPGTGKTKVTVNGGVIGADKAQMRLDMVDGTGKYDLKYNDDRGHVFGGGEGWVDNPAKYAVVNPSSGTPGIHNNKRLIDLMALVGETQVTIGETARKTTLVKGSVYGGSMNGHVLRDTKVTISGGQIGAGYYVKNNQIVDSLYAENKFFNPITYFGETHTDYDDVAAVDALHGCYRWDYVANNQRPFDPIALKTDPDQTNHSNSKPTNGETWFGSVYGGGSGYYPYFVKKVHEPTVDSCVWNPDAGKVFGHTEVKITGGHILSNVYGGCQTTDVGNYVEDGTTHQLYNNSGIAQSAKAIVTISGGTVGVPETISSIQDFPFMSSVYGGGQGNFRDEHKALNNVASTRVTISGNALVYGMVFGGSQNGHVLDSTKMLVKGGVIGTTGLSGYDGHVFGGGQGTICPNPGHLGDSLYAHAGRVGGNARVVMTNGKALGNLYGGGMVALTGVGESGWFDEYTTGTTYQSDKHGMAKVELSGGSVGNDFNGGNNLLKSTYASGNVYGGGRGKLDEYDQDDLGRSANSAVKISGSPTVYGSVYGGGQMANSGYWLGYEGWYATNTATTGVSITGSPKIGTELEFKDKPGIEYSHLSDNLTYYDTIRFVKYDAEPYDTTYLRVLNHTRTGNVYGGGQGEVKILGDSHRVAGLEQGHCAYTNVNINMDNGDNGGHIMGSVFGGSEQGVVWGETEVHIAGGTIGTTRITPDSLKYTHSTQTWSQLDVDKATYSYGSVYGGSYGKDYYSSFNNIDNPRQQMIDSVNLLSGRVYGNTLVEIEGGTIRGNVYGGGDMASVGVWDKVSNDLVPLADTDRPTYRGNATVTVSGGVIGPLDGTGLNAYVFGGGKGFANDLDGLRKAYANVDSTFVTVSGGTIYGSVFGGGSDSHVLGSTSVTVKSGANIGTDGLTTWDGNIFGGGRNFQNTNHTNGRVAGNTFITMDGGTIQGSIFGGGRMALTGVNMLGNPYVTEHVYDSVAGSKTIHGLATITVSGSSVIGNSDGDELLNGSNESVGDIFGSGKGDTKAYKDVLAGRVANTKIEVKGSPRIYGSVFGGGEMAGIGYWYTDNGKAKFYDKSGTAEVTIGATASDALEIGTDMEFRADYAHDDPDIEGDGPSYWTVYGSDGKLIHTCTGNVYGGSQGDVDTIAGSWVSMARSRRSYVTINGGTIKSRVFGGAEQGSVAGNTYVTVNGGTIGSWVNTDDDDNEVPATLENNYLFGGVYGGGYGSHNPIFNGTQTAYYHTAIVNDSTAALNAAYPGQNLWTADHLAGRVYGNTRVDILGGTIQGDVFGGASYAYIGGYGNSPSGNVQLNIGSSSQQGQTSVGTTIKGSVFGANNHSGTPYGNVRVDVYHTKHTDYDQAPAEPTEGWTHELLLANAAGDAPYTFAQQYALKEVYGGGNQASYTPNQAPGRTTPRADTVYVHYCENTIEDLYGGGKSADIGSSSVEANSSLQVEGGRFKRIFGGGNGSLGTPLIAANTFGTATTNIRGGVIEEVYGGNNQYGNIKTIDLKFNEPSQVCTEYVDEIFAGSNESPLIGDIVADLNCGEGTRHDFYGGTHNAVTYGNITLNVYGGETTNVYGGSKGTSLNPADIKKFPTSIPNPLPQPGQTDYNVVLDSVYRYMQAQLIAGNDLRGTGGNITVNLYGGTIENVYGGCSVNGNVEGNILINVIDVEEPTCPLDVTNIYGGGEFASCTPVNHTALTPVVSPVINVVHVKETAANPSANPQIPYIPGIRGNVFGGGKGDIGHIDRGKVTSNPQVNIGYDASHTNTIIEAWKTAHSTITPRVLIQGNVYGGGELAQVDGSTTVNVYQGEIGEIGYAYKHDNTTHAVYDSIYHKEYDVENHLIGGNVFGGGKGSEDDKDEGRVKGNSNINISGGHVYYNVYGGGEMGSIGEREESDEFYGDYQPVEGTGTATVTITGGQVGPAPKTDEGYNIPIAVNGFDGMVFGGGKGNSDDFLAIFFEEFTDVNYTEVIIDMPTGATNRIWGAVFGGAEDGHVLGNTKVDMRDGIIGTNGTDFHDGNIFGGGRNLYGFDNYNSSAGRVRGNAIVEMSGGQVLGNVYGGGSMGNVGCKLNGEQIDYDESEPYGKVTVSINGGEVGTAVDSDNIGNVFGGGKGQIDEDVSDWDYWGIVNRAEVVIRDIIEGNAIISSPVVNGSVFGGGEVGTVEDISSVSIEGGTIGGYSGTYGDDDYRQYGSVYGGGKGFVGNSNTDPDPIAGQIRNKATVNMSRGRVYENIYGGGKLARVGTAADPRDTEVTFTGGQVGYLHLTGSNGNVYGGGRGVSNDIDNDYKEYTNVRNTLVTIEVPANADITENRIWGNVFGGASDGHVLGNTVVKLKSGVIGTDGMQQGWDGNIFGGGEGDGSNFTVGRVEGNTTVEMINGTVLGNIYGGGRLALTGVDVDGEMQTGNHGNTKVMVKGGTVGNVAEIVEFTDFSMGNIYGGGKGYLDTDHPNLNDAEKSLLLGLTKNTSIEISDTLNNNTHVYGIVLGGGEIANVGKYTLTKSGGNITNIAVTEGATNVRVGGGIIGGDRAQMRYELAKPNDPTDWYSKYNDDLGYVYGGGEGWSDDPTAYPQIYADGTSNPQTSLLDLVATVQSTEVTITNDTIKTAGPNSGTPHKPWVKASVFGGAESGHVMGNTKVTIAGGLIGAGNGSMEDIRYVDDDFINPVTTEVTTSPTNNTLKGTANWHYEAPHNPYDPAEIRNQYNTETGEYGYKPCDGKSWFGNVFGGGSGWFPYVTGTTAGEFVSHWNPKSGKVWGNTEVIIKGGHILNNVYGGNEMTDVGGKATIKMSGGTVGVPRTAAQVAEQPVICYVFGGGCGDPRDIFYDKTNVAETDVQITGGTIYGSVFGGAEDGHVLGDAKVTVSQPTGKTTVIGSTGKSGADGNIFGGGRNFLHENYTAGRVEGNIDITMKGGTLLGNVFGGGRLGITGIDQNGNMKNNVADDPETTEVNEAKTYGHVTIDIQGGTVGNARYLNLTNTPDLYTNSNHNDTLAYTGHVFGGGKGIEVSGIEAYKLARVKNTEVKISETDATNNPTRILGNVYGGGELANVGWVTTPGDAFDSEKGGLAKIEISGGQVGIEQIGTAQATIKGGCVYGGGLGLAGGKAVLPFANVDTTYVNISGTAYITSSVFGGADNGHVWRNTSIEMTGGTVGQRNTLDELTVNANEQPITDHIYTGCVIGGGRGVTPVATSPTVIYNDTTGIVFGNTTIDIKGTAKVRKAVYGGGGLSHVGTFTRDGSGNITFTKGGKCTVSVAGNAHIGPLKEDLAGYDNTQLNTFFNNLGANAGWVFGAGCGLAEEPNLTFNDSTLVTIGGTAQVTGAVFGGGENGHVLDSTHVVISGGTIGGIPLHGTGSVNGTGDFTGVSFTATTNELTEDDYGSGPRVFRGNVYGGGKGNDTIADPSDKLVYNRHAGQVYGSSKVEVTKGTIYNRVYGGGLLASVGTFKYDDTHTDSIVGIADGTPKTGLAKVIVSGGTIGNDNNNINNGDVFGGGRGLVGRHWEPTYTEGDQVVNLAYVGNTEVTVKAGAKIYGNVYGGSNSGHVQEDAHVIVKGGTIGIQGKGGWHSNVYGGGGGQHQYVRNGSTNPPTMHHSITSGRVYGNTKVEISGGQIMHNVYGGGAIASVGTYNIYDLTNLFVSGTGDTEVTITGGTIGTDGNENGMVFGSGRGQIAPIGAFMDSLSYAVNTVVNIGTYGSATGPIVHGSVYGSGENGHVFQKATVNVYSGTIGCDSYNSGHAGFFANHGNVYGAGCGTDQYNEGGILKYNPRSGIVQGNTEVNIYGGHISHNVYGGGAMAMVGSYTPYGYTGGWGDVINGTIASTGKTVVNVSGGTIGTSNAPENVEHGNVYGGSRGPTSGNGFTNMALTDTCYVFISGTAKVLGSVFGGGAKSWTRTARVATVSGGTVKKDVYGGGQNGIDDNTPFTSLKTVNVRGGHIEGNVFGSSYIAEEKTSPVDDWVTGCNYWSSFVNITGGTIDHNVYGAGYGGSVDGSVCVNIGLTAVKSAPTNTTQTGLTQANVFRYAGLGNTPPGPDKLKIGGNVFGGSFQYESSGENWNHNFDITGYSTLFIDGEDYNTTSTDESATNYMNIGGGIFGSGNHCESGEKGREIVLRNYGTRNPNGDPTNELTEASRALTTIQRGGIVLLDNSNVQLTGRSDISNQYPHRSYGLLQVETSLMVANASGIVLGTPEVPASGTDPAIPAKPAYMDSIRTLQSLYLKDGVVTSYSQLGSGSTANWEMVGIHPDNANKLYRIHSSGDPTELTTAQENVILFHDDSRLWVRFVDETDKKTKYGQLYGFFRMRSPFPTDGSETFAYARPKLSNKVNPIAGYDVSGGNTWNADDGGFLSYDNTNNDFTTAGTVVMEGTAAAFTYTTTGNDGGTEYTKGKQYPYFNFNGLAKDNTVLDPVDFREWRLPKKSGHAWYVDGRGIGETTGGWGKDADGFGLYPDKPKQTITGTKGIANNLSPTYNQATDLVFVVGSVNGLLEELDLNPSATYPLRLYRYPGGHKMSNDKEDAGGGTAPTDESTWTGVNSEVTQGPGTNTGMMIHANDDLVLDNVVVNGLFENDGAMQMQYEIPASFNTTTKYNISEPLVVTESGTTLTLKGGTTLTNGYNNTDASGHLDEDGDSTPEIYNYYVNSDYNGSSHNGGGLYVAPDIPASGDDPAVITKVKVEGLVTITGNKQKNGSGTITSNVYLPTFGSHLFISNTLDPTSSIGVTSPIRNTAASYEDNTLSPVAQAVNNSIAETAWRKCNFTDDLGWFFVSGNKIGDPDGQRTTYYNGAGTKNRDNKTLYFGWTWASVVRTEPTGYSNDNIDSPEDLAWLITSVPDATIKQTADLDMGQYVWVPIGSNSNHFFGTYDGQGHLIENLSIDFIGTGDKIYERTNYGLFGNVENGTIDRTFVVSGIYKPYVSDLNGTAGKNIGGLVGFIHGTSTVSNSEAAVTIMDFNNDATVTGNFMGGLVAKMDNGEIHSSMAMSTLSVGSNYHGVLGGLVGSAAAGTINNSFANGTFKISSNADASVKAGGLIGDNTAASMRNCYVTWIDGNTTLSSTNFGRLMASNATTNTNNVQDCYADTTGNFGYTVSGSVDVSCKQYMPVISADNLGYMYTDNKVEGDTAMFVTMNRWVTTANGSGHKYAKWARPGLAEINGDLPVLLLSNYNESGKIGAGDFRNMGTYAGGPALQYGGPIRDAERQIDSALVRTNAAAADDYLFVYGDITEQIKVASGKTITQSKISIHEDAAILAPGVLGKTGAKGDYTETYVGITFDNSKKSATATYGINYGLSGGTDYLSRDWHMFSTPLSNAPLGFDYNIPGTEPGTTVNTNSAQYYTFGDIGNYFCNPWVNQSMEFSWLNGGTGGNNRYWMKGWTNSQGPRTPLNFVEGNWVDGYFPSSLSEPSEFGATCVAGTDEYGRYPYGMDFYTWTEPDYHWINFKRNGPNHWHSDEPHNHLAYLPADMVGYEANVNEENLIVGRGYMAAIATQTFLQSHGTLNTGAKGIKLTSEGAHCKGWNLVGNPYHAYIDFDKLAETNSDLLAKDGTHPFYVVYNADGYNGTPSDAFVYYVATGSKGGAYAGRYLHPHQGFYVKMDEGATGDHILNFSDGTGSMVVSRETAGDAPFRDEQPKYPLVNLFLSSDNGCNDVTVVELERPEWGGAVKLRELRNGNGVFYAQHDNTHFAALFAKVGTDRVPLWFEAKEDDIYTIKWNTANGDFHSMYLIDNKLGVHYDMLRNDTYSFEGNVGDYPSRFLIVFSLTDVDEHLEGNGFVFFDGSQWMVTGEGDLEFVDALGQVLVRTQVNGGQTRVAVPDVAPGVYLFRLTNSEGTRAQKVIVKR